MSNPNMDPDGFRETAAFTIQPTLGLQEVYNIMKIVQSNNLDIVAETKIFECLLKWINVQEEPGRAQYGFYLLNHLKLEKLTIDDWRRNFQENKELLQVELIRQLYTNTLVSKLIKCNYISQLEIDQEVFWVKKRFSLP